MNMVRDIFHTKIVRKYVSSRCLHYPDFDKLFCFQPALFILTDSTRAISNNFFALLYRRCIMLNIKCSLAPPAESQMISQSEPCEPLLSSDWQDKRFYQLDFEEANNSVC